MSRSLNTFKKPLKTGIESCRLGHNMGKIPKSGMFWVHGVAANSSEQY